MNHVVFEHIKRIAKFFEDNQIGDNHEENIKGSKNTVIDVEPNEKDSPSKEEKNELFERKYKDTKMKFGVFENIKAIVKFFKDNCVGYEQKEDIKFPDIVVIGMESSGKSSLLENITKRSIFPRNISICTLCPVKLIINDYAANRHNSAYIRHTSFKGDKIIGNDKDIVTTVNQIFKSIGQENISSDPIEVYLFDENLPTITLLDLPGVRQYPENMAKASLDLLDKYVTPNSMILLTVPATDTRLTSNRAIAYVINKNLLKNTLMILTMCDRLDKDYIPDLLVNRLTKESDEIKNLQFRDICAVINRKHKDKETIEDSNVREQKWFEKNIHHKVGKSNAHKLGISNLITMIGTSFRIFVKDNYVPEKVAEYDAEISKLIKKRDYTGPVFNDDKLLSEYNNEYQDHIKSVIKHMHEQTSTYDPVFNSNGWWNTPFNITRSTFEERYLNRLSSKDEDKYYLQKYANLAHSMNNHCMGSMWLVFEEIKKPLYDFCVLSERILTLTGNKDIYANRHNYMCECFFKKQIKFQIDSKQLQADIDTFVTEHKQKYQDKIDKINTMKKNLEDILNKCPRSA